MLQIWIQGIPSNGGKLMLRYLVAERKLPITLAYDGKNFIHTKNGGNHATPDNTTL